MEGGVKSSLKSGESSTFGFINNFVLWIFGGAVFIYCISLLFFIIVLGIRDFIVLSSLPEVTEVIGMLCR